MNISKFSVNNSMFVNLLSVFFLAAGVLSMLTLRREAFPPADFNYVVVTTAFRNASAQKVETLLTTPLERELKEVDRIEEITSKSDNGYSSILLKLDSNAKDREVQKIVNDIQKAIDRVRGLPEEVDERPLVTQILMEEIPIIKIALGGSLSEFRLRDQVDILREKLSEIDGVASVDRASWRDEEYRVEVNAEKLKEYHLSFLEIASSLKAENVDTPGGLLKTNGKEIQVKIKGELTNLQDIENTIIRANDMGNWIRLKDVATIRHTFKDEDDINKINGTKAITLTVVKKKRGDIIRIVNNVFKVIAEFKKTAPPEISIDAVDDLAYYVKRRLSVLKSNGLIGFLLVVAVLFFFLPPIPAIMTSLGIPIAMAITIWTMSLLDITINLMTMFGLIMIIGIIVDDGIIISENIYRYMEEGLDPRTAAVKGAGEVMVPVISMVLTTIVAFIPLMSIEGMMGKFIKYIPFIVIIALSASLMEALVILPAHMADFVKPSMIKKSRGKTLLLFEKLKQFYSSVLKASISRKYITAAVALILLVLSIAAAKLFLPFMLFGGASIERFTINLKAEPDTNLYRTNDFISEVEKIVSEIPAECMSAYETNVGKIIDRNSQARGSNLAQIIVYLTPLSDRKRTADEIIGSIMPQIEAARDNLKNKGVEELFIEKTRGGPPVGKPVELRIRGEKFETLAGIANEITGYLRTVKGLSDITDSYSLGGEELNIIVDDEKAQRAFLSKAQIAASVRAAFSGIISTTIKREKAEKEISVTVTLPEKQRNSVDILNKLVVPNKFGNLIPLAKVIKIEKSRSLKSIEHINGYRYISVTSDINQKEITPVKAAELVREKFSDISLRYPGYRIDFAGEAKESAESFRNLAKAFLIAALLIYLILATQFNSLIQPFIIMLNIPFSIIGFVIAFIVHNEPISFLGLMGFIGLVGVAVNDAIVLIDFINKRRAESKLVDTVVESCLLRFRPVLITSITTIFGLSTVAYGIGGLDPFLKPMALAMSWGLLFSTILTLLVVPCVFLITEDLKSKIKNLLRPASHS